MECKLLVKKAMTDLIKNAGGPSRVQQTFQVFGALGSEITHSFKCRNSSVHQFDVLHLHEVNSQINKNICLKKVI